MSCKLLIDGNSMINTVACASLYNATDTDFEKQISGAEHLEALIALLEANYIKEKAESEKSLQLVPRKKFRLFKQLSFSMIAVAVILIIPLIYLLPTTIQLSVMR